MASFTAPTPVSVNELIAQAMSTMTALWDEIGTSDSDRDAVKKDLKVKLSRCVAEVEQNETLIRDGKLSEIKQSLDQYNKKALMLQKTTTTIEDKRANETLTDAELRTRESLSLITEEFDKAKNIHEELLTTLHALYVTLNGKNEAFPAAFATIGEFLSEQRQMALTEEIKEKTNEKNLRVESRETLVSEWEELVEELCLSPDDNSFDGNMHELHALMTDEIKPQKDAETPIGLTIVDLGAIGDRVSELGEEKERRLALITKLGQQITTLWEKLNIDQEERDSFFAMHDHLGQKEIDACQSELERLTALKKERVRPMIMNERTAITELWNKLHYSTEQQNDFGQFTTTEDLFNEDVLEQHEVYHQKLVEQWNVQEPIMALIEKREKILTLPQKIRDIKNFKKGDPNPEKPGKTLTSGDMSKMLQKRTKFESIYKKGLPKCEAQLIKELTKWKIDYGTDIMIAGNVYLDVVKAATENRENGGKNDRQKIKDAANEKYKVPILPRNTLKPRK